MLNLTIQREQNLNFPTRKRSQRNVERVVPQHLGPLGPGHEDHPPDQQGGDGSQTYVRYSQANGGGIS